MDVVSGPARHVYGSLGRREMLSGAKDRDGGDAFTASAVTGLMPTDFCCSTAGRGLDFHSSIRYGFCKDDSASCGDALPSDLFEAYSSAGPFSKYAAQHDGMSFATPDTRRLHGVSASADQPAPARAPSLARSLWQSLCLILTY